MEKNKGVSLTHFLEKQMLEMCWIFNSMDEWDFFQAKHALYTPVLDENCGSSDFVQDIWICYKLQCTKLCTLHFQHLLPGTKFCTSLFWMRIVAVAALYKTSGYVKSCSVQNFVHCTSGIYCRVLLYTALPALTAVVEM